MTLFNHSRYLQYLQLRKMKASGYISAILILFSRINEISAWKLFSGDLNIFGPLRSPGRSLVQPGHVPRPGAASDE